MSKNIRPLVECTIHGMTVARGWGKSWSMEYCHKCATPAEMLVELQEFCESEGLRLGLRVEKAEEKTAAQKISSLFGDDGSVWETVDGFGIIYLCIKAGGRAESDGPNGYTRYVFPDGSAILDATDAWDIEGSTPYSFASEGNPND